MFVHIADITVGSCADTQDAVRAPMRRLTTAAESRIFDPTAEKLPRLTARVRTRMLSRRDIF